MKYLMLSLVGLCLSLSSAVQAKSTDDLNTPEMQYQALIESVKQQQSTVVVKQSDLSQGNGLNARSDRAAYALEAGSASVASTIPTSLKNELIAAARAGTSSKTSYADVAGTTNKVATSERNSIINTARSGNATLSSVCNMLPNVVVGSKTYNFRWSSNACRL